VRTIPMDAWASVAHHLEYKQEVDIPRDLRTTFNALAGLFYVADSVSELFRKGIEESRAKLMKAVRKDVFDLDQEINYDSIQAYARWKFPDRSMHPLDALADTEASSIVKELTDSGYRSLRQIDDKLEAASPLWEQMEKEMFEDAPKLKWSVAGVIRYCLTLTDDDYFYRQHPGGKRGDFDAKMFGLTEKYRSKLRSPSAQNPK